MSAFDKKKNGIISAIEFRSPKVKIFYWLVFAVCICLAVICIAPIIWIILSAFKDISEFYSSPPTIIPKTFQPWKLKDAWNMMHLGTYLRNSLAIALGEVLFCVVACGFAGYVLSRLKPKGTSLILKVVLLSMMLPGSVSLVSGYMQAIDFPYLHINFTNKFIYFWLSAIGNSYYTLMFKSFFDSISISLVEAAKIDGCSEFKIFFKLIIPLSIPIVIVISIFTFNDAWSNFMTPYLMLKSENMKTITQMIFEVKMSGSQVSQDIYLIMILMTMVPPMIIFLLFNKHIMNGVNIGGVKG